MSEGFVKETIGAISARRLLERAPEEKYLEECAWILSRPHELKPEKRENSVVIFRLSDEWLAIPTVIFFKVEQYRPIHCIPHHSSQLILGVMNLSGLLVPCVNMHHILEIYTNPKEKKRIQTNTTKRMFAIQKEKEKWIFPVDEVFGIYHCEAEALTNVPVTVKKSTANFFKGMFNWSEKNVGYLDEELLFYTLKRVLQ